MLNVLLGVSNPTFTIYPVQNYGAGAGFGATVPGATMTVAAGAWPAYVTIVTAIATEYWLTQLFIDTVTLVAGFDLQIYNLTFTRTVWEEKFSCTAVSSNLSPTTFPYPIYCQPTSVIQGRIGGAVGKTCNVSLLVATGI
jgi:hypothetical protein